MLFQVLRYGVAAAATVAALAAVHAHADGLEAGMWKVINKPEINGQPGPEAQNMRCLTPDDVNDLGRTFSPVSRTTNSACERVEFESTPQRVKWRLQCRGQLDMDVAGEFVFDRSDHYTATVLASSSMMGQVMQRVRTAIEGQRVGECPKE
jgi:hypothetical protein